MPLNSSLVRKSEQGDMVREASSSLWCLQVSQWEDSRDMWFSPDPCHQQGVRDPCSCPKEACPGRFSLESASRRAKDGNILRKLRIISVPIHCHLVSRKGSIRCNWNFCLVDRYRCATCYQAPKTLPNLDLETPESETNVPHPSLSFSLTSRA